MQGNPKRTKKERLTAVRIIFLGTSQAWPGAVMTRPEGRLRRTPTMGALDGAPGRRRRLQQQWRSRAPNRRAFDIAAGLRLPHCPLQCSMFNVATPSASDPENWRWVFGRDRAHT